MSDRLGRKEGLVGLDQARREMIRRLRNEWWVRTSWLGMTVTMRDWVGGAGIADALEDSLLGAVPVDWGPQIE